MARRVSEEAIYLEEHRRFRRLEVSLPVWLAEEEDFDKPHGSPWSLGYTRDVSMGGSKIFVPQGEEAKWRDVAARKVACLLRFDVPGIDNEEYIIGRVRHVEREKNSSHCWLGVEYDEGAEHAKGEAVRAGLHNVRTRRRLQATIVAALLVIGLGTFLINDLYARNRAQEQQIAGLKKQQEEELARLASLSAPGLVSTRAVGIERSFQRQKSQKRFEELAADIRRLNDPDNQEQGEKERAREQREIGLPTAGVPASGVHVQLGVAWPYGYAWPQVTTDLEQLLNRRVPLIVTFRDFQAPFPMIDCREAKFRGKTLQITWEPWHFSNPGAIKLQNIIAGKHDRYIDSWAAAAKSFGSEVWIRWGHEFNGNWYPWSVSANNRDPKIYARAFRHVRDRFTRNGAFNVRWIWCINAETVPDEAWNDPFRAYPGDAYVDMIAIDGYNFGATLPSSNWQSFTQIFGEKYSRVIKKFRNKPIMIGEVGCATVGGDKVAWIKEMDVALRRVFTRVEGVVWFEAQKEADWRMISSPGSLAASRAMWNRDYYKRGVL